MRTISSIFTFSAFNVTARRTEIKSDQQGEEQYASWVAKSESSEFKDGLPRNDVASLSPRPACEKKVTRANRQPDSQSVGQTE